MCISYLKFSPIFSGQSREAHFVGWDGLGWFHRTWAQKKGSCFSSTHVIFHDVCLIKLASHSSRFTVQLSSCILKYNPSGYGTLYKRLCLIFFPMCSIMPFNGFRWLDGSFFQKRKCWCEKIFFHILIWKLAHFLTQCISGELAYKMPP